MDLYTLTLEQFDSLTIEQFDSLPILELMTFSEENGLGGISISGCAFVRITENYTYKFAIGSSPYILEKAMQGIIRQTCIKYVELIGFTGRSPVFIYKDFLNRTWEEIELGTLEEAQQLIKKWYYFTGQYNFAPCKSEVVVDYQLTSQS